MASIFGRLKGSGGSTSPSTASPSAKKDPLAPQITPLQRLLENAGPIREDGSDKFFGMENFGNSCYCNSILQCLYYSEPFREHVLSYPTRSPLDSIKPFPSGIPKPDPNAGAAVNGTAASPGSPTTKINPASLPTSPARKAAMGLSQGTPGNRPEDKPDTPEYKKKHALLNGPVLTMDNDRASEYDMEESLFTSLKDVFEGIAAAQSRTGVVSPKKFLEVLKRDNVLFNSTLHQDAHEFLNWLLNEVVRSVEVQAKKADDLKRLEDIQKSSKTDPTTNVVAESLASVVDPTPGLAPGITSPNTTSWVHELFEGTLTSETKCLTCENVSQRDEAFLDLSVDLDEHSSVTSCLRRFSEEEMLCERNKFHCDRCAGLQEAEKRMKIKRLPKILNLHLKRFKYNDDWTQFLKLFQHVKYPSYLRLFNTTDDAEDSDCLYELYGVVVHIGGGPNQGHYVSIIKTKDRGWLLFDDEMVEPVHKSYVENFYGGKPSLACAYVLFYQQTTLEEVQREQAAEGLAANKAPQTVKDGAIIKPTGIPSMSPLSPVQSVGTPTIPEQDQFVSLDHAATAPAQSPGSFSPPAFITDPTPVPAAAAHNETPTKASDTRTKKERAEEEKRAKEAEKTRRQEQKDRQKEEQAAAKQRNKNREAQHLEFSRQFKQSQKDLEQAKALSKQTKAEEDAKLATEGGGGTPDGAGAGTSTGTVAGAVETNGKDVAGGSRKISSTLGRFKSIRGTSKLFGAGGGKGERGSISSLPSGNPSGAGAGAAPSQPQAGAENPQTVRDGTGSGGIRDRPDAVDGRAENTPSESTPQQQRQSFPVQTQPQPHQYQPLPSQVSTPDTNAGTTTGASDASATGSPSRAEQKPNRMNRFSLRKRSSQKVL